MASIERMNWPARSPDLNPIGHKFGKHAACSEILKEGVVFFFSPTLVQKSFIGLNSSFS